MAEGINKVILLGNLGRDPELRWTQNNKAVCNFGLATNSSRMDGGQRVEQTEWHNVVVWGKQAEACDRYLSKGSQVFIEGRLQTRSWNDRDGNPRKTTEVVAMKVLFIGGRGEASNGRQNGYSGPPPRQTPPPQAPPQAPPADDYDEIPF